jgi:lipid II:glycine glycyltransferase (peptidoglycan interpeptide bridge formation enzyme)
MKSLPPDWNERIAGLPGANFLQTREWAEIKRRTGWDPQALTWEGTESEVAAAGVVLRRRIRAGGFAAKMSVMYSPRGPLCDWMNAGLRKRVLDDLQVIARRSGAIFLKIDPAISLGLGFPGQSGAEDDPFGLEFQADLQARGWKFSDDQIQFRNTAILDLNGSEEDWLARMKQKTRYNVRLAQKKGVSIRRGSAADYALLYRMYAETAIRDGFVIRPDWYYHNVWREFTSAGMCYPLIAEADGEPLAALILFVYAGKAWYLYGMSRERQREKMPNYLLQWEAMRTAHAMGARTYDLWGAPDLPVENDPLWGVYRFKEGLGARVVRTLGAWDFPARPVLYSFYTRILPRFLDLLRKRGKEQMRREVGT